MAPHITKIGSSSQQKSYWALSYQELYVERMANGLYIERKNPI